MDVWLTALSQELILYAATGFLIFGLEDVLFDLIWLAKRIGAEPEWQFSEHRARNTNQVAVFVPAWQEETVIAAMLRRCSKSWQQRNLVIFVGCYPNDFATIRAVRSVNDDRICPVILDHAGPTTKADCLNGLWQALRQHEQDKSCLFAAIVLHDAEDKVHRSEIALFAELIDRYALVQIPVVPEPDRHSHWIAGHYLDEFAEAHRKDMPVRQAIGASLPSAGTGCAIRRNVLESFARQRQGLPFDEASLTEDYELGLRIGEAGLPTFFARINSSAGDPIVVRSCFPSTLRSSVTQKRRWIIGIALAGWDRTGWAGNFAEHWMRWRDRRSLLAASFILAAYVGATSQVIATLFGRANEEGRTLAVVLVLNLCIFAWRLTMRAAFTTAQYGWRQGLLALPRIFVSNVIMVMAAWRALLGYCRILMGRPIHWDKTSHHMPQNMID
jgi:bacteriophage N4 adsorption protein B